MPVIGRLDKQVNDVLIDPVGKRRRRRDEGDGARPPLDTRRDATDEDERGVARNTDEKSRRRTEHDEDRGRGDEQLPVWLL